MKIPRGLLLICLVLGCGIADAQMRWQFGMRNECMGTNYCQFISSADHKGYPIWNPAQDKCPLAPTNAVALAKAALLEKWPSIQNVTSPEVQLRAISASSFEGVWFYVISFYATLPDNKHASVSFIVGLDGIVPPMKECKGD